MRPCGATSLPRMSATPRRSCFRISPPPSPARSSTSTRASATSSQESPLLLLLQISGVDIDVRAAAKALHHRLILRRAVELGEARGDLRIAFLDGFLDHLGNA